MRSRPQPERRRQPAVSIRSDDGTRLLAVDRGRASARLDRDPHRAGPAGAPAIVAVGHAAAVAAAASVLDAAGERAPGRLPQTVQLSVDLFRPDSPGALVAEAELTHRGRTTLVVDVRVRDAEDRLVAALVATQLAPPCSLATPAGP